MSGPLWAQILLGVLIAIPVLILLGAVLTFAVGGILGLGESMLARMGTIRFHPGVLSVKHHGMPTPTG